MGRSAGRRRAALGLALLALAAACSERGSVNQGSAGRSGVFAAPERPEERDPAPAFTLVDQDGRPFSSQALRGRVALVDFIFTHCGGPCPILTGIHVAVQRRLPEELRSAVVFVSISVDPERDTPEVLKQYAQARGADLSSWSFLTGEPGKVRDVALGFGVGSTREAGGDIAHTTATFLLDREGRIARRITGVEQRPEELLAALRELL